jgi:signal transduction histidine kinase
VETACLFDGRVLSHEDRLERVIGHIVQNALDACAGDATKVSIRVTSAGDFATIEIADLGQGMTQEFLRERLFHPFQTTKSQGMGIGMYESYQYLNSIGGRISANSQPERGSTFCVFLPLANPSPRGTA